MSDFKAKISAELDTSKIEQQIDELNGKKIKLDVDTGDTTKEVQNVNKQIVNTRKSTQSFGDTLKKSLNIGAAASLTSEAFGAIRTAADKATDAIKDIDGAVTDLRMATNGSYGDTLKLVQGYNMLGKRIGAITTEVSDSADAWLRQGHSISETNTLIRDSMILSKVAKLDSADSTEYLTSAMKGYKVEVENVIGIVDKLTAVDLVSATDAGGLAEAMSRTAVSAHNADIEMEKLLGYLAVTGEVTQKSMSSIGEGFKTIFTRMADIKAGKLELVDEDGTVESLSDVETVLNNMGIKLRESNNEFRDFGDVLDEVAAAWGSYSSVQQAAISKAFAGTRQSENFKVLMENYSSAISYMETAMNSAGTAEQKFGAYLDSIEAKTKSLQAAFESLAVNTFSTELFGGIIEATTSLVTFLDKTNLLKSSLAGIAGAGTIKVFTMLASGIANAAMRMNEFNSALSILKSGKIGESQMHKLVQLTGNLSNSQLQAVVSSKALSTEQRMAILTATGLSTAEAQATLATMGLATAEGTATTATFSLSGALKGLWLTLKANPLILVASAITAAFTAFHSYNQHIQELVDTAREASNAWSEASNSLEKSIEQINELRTALDSGTLSEQQAYEAKSKLLSIQESLISTYGKEADGIDLVNGEIKEQIDLLEALSAAQAQNFLNENRKGIQTATNEITEERNLRLGSFMDLALEETEAIKEVVAQYEEYIKIVDSGDGVGMNIMFTGNAEEASEIINDFMTDIRNLSSEFENTSIFDTILDTSSGKLNKVNEILDNYQDIFKQAQMAQVVTDTRTYTHGDDAKTAITWLNDYTKAVEKYNEALASGDTTKISEAKTEFDKVNAAMMHLADHSMLQYRDLIIEIAEQLNKAAAARIDFANALESSGGFEDFKDLGLTDVDLKAMLNTEGFQDGEMQFRNLIEAAVRFGFITDKSSDEVDKLIALLVELGYISGDSFGAAEDKVSDLNKEISKSASDTEKVLSSISGIKEVIYSQKVGESLSVENFNSEELKDYTSALEYNNGALQLNIDKVNELVKAKSEEQIATIEADKALTQTSYLEKATEIERLQKKIKDKNFAQGETEESIQATISSLRGEMGALRNTCAQYDLMTASLREATSAYQHWINAQNASESGDMFDDAIDAMNHIEDTLNNTDSEFFGRVNRADYKAAVDFLIPDSVDKEDSAAINAYLDDIKDFLVFDNEGNFTGLDIAEFCKRSTEEGLMILDEATGAYSIAGEKTMEEFAEGLGLSLPLVQAIFGELEEFTHFNWGDEASKTMADLAVQANEAAIALREINDYKEFEISLDLSKFNTPEEKVAHLEQTIKDMQKIVALDIDSADVEHATSVIRYCIAMKQQLTAPDVMMVDTTMMEGQLGNAISLLQNFVDAKNRLEQANTLGLDTTNAQKQLDDATKAIQGLDASLTGEKALNIDTTDIDTINESIQRLNSDYLINIGVNEEAFIGLVEKTAEPINQEVIVNVNDKQYDLLKKNLRKPLYTTIYAEVVTNGSSKPSSGSGVSNSNTSGNKKPNLPVSLASATGTAMAGGNLGTSVGGKTLMGELGEEIVVDTRTGRWYTVGTNGAEFVDIPRGSLVFNHLQTESLLKNRFVASRAAAFAKGNAMASGNAMVSGGFIPSSVVKEYSSPGKGSTSNTHDVTDELEVFDWIEVAIDRIGRAVEKLTSVASSAYKSLKTKLGASADAITLVNEKIAIQQAAYERYLKDADSIDLSDDIKQKVQIGEIDIAEYDSDTQDLINEYKDLYEKGIDAKDAIVELHEELASLYKERFDNIQEDYNNQLEDLEHLTALYESELEDHKNVDSSEVYDGLRDVQLETIELLTDELEELEQAFSDAVASGLVEVGSDAWYEMRDAIHEVNEELIDARENLANLAIEEFEKIQDSFDNQADMLDHAVEQLENEIDLIEAKGRSANEEYYKALQDLEGERIDMLEQELSDLENSLEEGISSGNIEVGSDAWYEMQSSIADVKEELQEANIALEHYNQTMRELDWEAFEKQQEVLSDAIDENNHKLDLMDDKVLVDRDGNITSDGNDSIDLHTSNYDAYMKQANAYANEIKRLDEELANDPNNEILLERRKELLDLQRDSISAAEDEKQAIKELNEEAEELRIEAMKRSFSNAIDENDYKLDLLDGEDFVDENGNITTTGYDAARLHAANYDVYMDQANACAKEIEKINSELANDPNNEVLLERREELLDLQRDSILAAKDEKEAIEELRKEAEELRIEAMQEALEKEAESAKEALEDQLESMRDLIDSYTKALDNAKDLYDYQRKISEQTDKIGDIKKQLSAYEGDDSEETRAKIQQLKEDLKTAKDDLEEMEYDKYVADQKALLDDIYSRYEQNINERIDQIDANLETAIESLNAGTDSVIDSILSSTESIGSIIDSELQSATGEAVDNIQSSVGESTSDVQSSIDDSSAGIQSSIDESANEIQSSIDGAAGTIDDKLSSANDTLSDILDATKDLLEQAADAIRDTDVTKDSVDKNVPNVVPEQPAEQMKPSTTPAAPQTSISSSTQEAKKEITVGGKINAGSALIYGYAGDTSGEGQYFKNDPIYTVLKEQNGYLQVRHHKLSSGITGWFKKSDVKAYKTGGLVDYTGLAQLDGTPSKPELVLNAQDTENFLELKDVLSKLAQNELSLQSGFTGYKNIPSVSHVGLFDSSQEIMRILSQKPTNSFQQTVGDINVDVHIDHVQDYEDFKTQLIRDRKFESAIRAMTVDRLVGGSSLAKNKYTR